MYNLSVLIFGNLKPARIILIIVLLLLSTVYTNEIEMEEIVFHLIFFFFN